MEATKLEKSSRLQQPRWIETSLVEWEHSPLALWGGEPQGARVDLRRRLQGEHEPLARPGGDRDMLGAVEEVGLVGGVDDDAVLERQHVGRALGHPHLHHDETDSWKSTVRRADIFSWGKESEVLSDNCTVLILSYITYTIYTCLAPSSPPASRQNNPQRRRLSEDLVIWGVSA